MRDRDSQEAYRRHLTTDELRNRDSSEEYQRFLTDDQLRNRDSSEAYRRHLATDQLRNRDSQEAYRRDLTDYGLNTERALTTDQLRNRDDLEGYRRNVNDWEMGNADYVNQINDSLLTHGQRNQDIQNQLRMADRERQQYIQDFGIRHEMKMSDLNTLLGIATGAQQINSQLGQTALSVAGQIGQLMSQQATAYGMGQIGAANARVNLAQTNAMNRQMGFSNLVNLIGLGMGSGLFGGYGNEEEGGNSGLNSIMQFFGGGGN